MLTQATNDRGKEEEIWIINLDTNFFSRGRRRHPTRSESSGVDVALSSRLLSFHTQIPLNYNFLGKSTEITLGRLRSGQIIIKDRPKSALRVHLISH
jgi:hypothetical protein